MHGQLVNSGASALLGLAMHVQTAYPPLRGLLDVEVMLVGGDILDQVP